MAKAGPSNTQTKNIFESQVLVPTFFPSKTNVPVPQNAVSFHSKRGEGNQESPEPDEPNVFELFNFHKKKKK